MSLRRAGTRPQPIMVAGQPEGESKRHTHRLETACPALQPTHDPGSCRRAGDLAHPGSDSPAEVLTSILDVCQALDIKKESSTGAFYSSKPALPLHLARRQRTHPRRCAGAFRRGSHGAACWHGHQVGEPPPPRQARAPVAKAGHRASAVHLHAGSMASALARRRLANGATPLAGASHAASGCASRQSTCCVHSSSMRTGDRRHERECSAPPMHVNDLGIHGRCIRFV